MSFLSGLFGRDEPPPADRSSSSSSPPPPSPQTRVTAQAPPPPTTAPADASPEQLERLLVELVRRVNRAGGRMPEGGVPGVHAVVDALHPLLVYLRSNPPTEAEMIPLRAIVTDYLPTTVDRFLALPPDFAATHRTVQGRTPAGELVEQLTLLLSGTQEYATAIYAGDAQELTNQGRFLETKFLRSDLDL